MFALQGFDAGLFRDLGVQRGLERNLLDEPLAVPDTARQDVVTVLLGIGVKVNWNLLP